LPNVNLEHGPAVISNKPHAFGGQDVNVVGNWVAGFDVE
jgi:hypothetical protein